MASFSMMQSTSRMEDKVTKKRKRSEDLESDLQALSPKQKKHRSLSLSPKHYKDDNSVQKHMTPEQLAYERIIKEKSLKYKRNADSKVKVRGIRDKKLRSKLQRQEEKFQESAEKAARSEILHTAQAGDADLINIPLHGNLSFIEAENEMESTWKVKQSDIEEQADLTNAAKIFNLNLDKNGSYVAAYSSNGRYLLIGSEKGHVALIDWYKSKLICELNLRENVRDVAFLHNETMFAVAQKKNVYIYDKQGVEIHRLRNHRHPYKLVYLPYHFLLCSVGREGILRYQDTSTGELIAEMKSKLGFCNTMAQNPRNAIIHLGHSNGSVTLWSPNVHEPLVKMLCHRGAVTSMAIDTMGRYMVTSGADGCMKIWDLKSFSLLQTYFVKRPVTYMCLSQNGLLAIAFGCHIQIWKDFVNTEASEPYMIHQLPQGGNVRSIAFCPFDDVLGVGHDHGFSSILIPGAGEANIDTYAANPFESKKQRREATVQKLLDKIQPHMIVLDPDSIGTVSKLSQDEHKREVDVALANKEGGDSQINIIGPKHKASTKQSNINEKRKEEIQAENILRTKEAIQRKKEREQQMDTEDADANAPPRSALDRFSKNSRR